MNVFKSLSEQIFSFKNEDFDALALNIFEFQARNNDTYKAYIQNLGVDIEKVLSIDQIPFLPIEFYKTHKIKSGDWNAQSYFESSGTSGANTSRHYYPDQDFYLKNCDQIFSTFYGAASNYVWLALLPSYLERDGSGLVAMADHFIRKGSSEHSGFYLDQHDLLVEKLISLCRQKKQVVLLGVTFALLDLKLIREIDFPELIVMETGGMKGRREELVRNDVHSLLKTKFGVNKIHSEYGMTELFSQAYSQGEGIFYPARTMRVMCRDINDPLTISKKLKSGGLNVIDLANVHSCSFIETKDLGKVYKNGSFEVLGRIDNSDIRGCNLMLT
jgi:phenylacetate-coenzyme A ligase PaaK-like adenylate-forming protein